MDFDAAICSQPEATKLMKPGMGSLDNPSIDPQPAAMFGPSAGNLGVNAPRSQFLAMGLRIIPAIGIQLLRALAWVSNLTRNRRDLVHHRHQLVDIRRSRRSR